MAKVCISKRKTQIKNKVERTSSGGPRVVLHLGIRGPSMKNIDINPPLFPLRWKTLLDQTQTSPQNRKTIPPPQPRPLTSPAEINARPSTPLPPPLFALLLFSRLLTRLVDLPPLLRPLPLLFPPRQLHRRNRRHSATTRLCIPVRKHALRTRLRHCGKSPSDFTSLFGSMRSDSEPEYKSRRFGLGKIMQPLSLPLPQGDVGMVDVHLWQRRTVAAQRLAQQLFSPLTLDMLGGAPWQQRELQAQAHNFPVECRAERLAGMFLQQGKLVMNIQGRPRSLRTFSRIHANFEKSQEGHASIDLEALHSLSSDSSFFSQSVSSSFIMFHRISLNGSMSNSEHNSRMPHSL